MRARLNIGGEAEQVSAVVNADGTAVITVGEKQISVEQFSAENGMLRFRLAGEDYRFHVHNGQGAVQVTDGRDYYSFAQVEHGAAAGSGGAGGGSGSAAALTSQMPGTVLKLLVEPGAEVAKGTALLILEAMKMEHEIAAPSDGTVTGFPHAEGARVMPGDLLVDFAAAE
jgi:biotin carboxyl carrier protein